MIIESTDMIKVYKKFLENPVNEKSKEFCQKMLDQLVYDKIPHAYNHGVNDGEAAGRTIHHLHWHIIPRYVGDVDDPTGGIRCVIPWRTNYKK
jgi:histidine triad (HIT) family protein